MKLAVLLLGLVAAASAADIPLTWDFTPDMKPYPTESISVGDSVTFNWMGLHGVYQLAMGPGVGCPASFPAGPATVGAVAPMGSYTFTPTQPGMYNFACQVGDHCTDGMLIAIVVGSGPSLAPGAMAPMAPSTAPVAAMGDSEGDEG